MEPASPSTPSADVPAGDPAPATDPAADLTTPLVDPVLGDAPAAGDEPATEPAPAEPAAAAAPPAKPRVDLTARLAKASREKREAENAAKTAARERDEAKAQLAAFDAKVAKARGGDSAAVRELIADAKLEFRGIVDAFADQPDPESLPADQRALNDVAAVRKELEELKKAREDESKAAQARAAQAAETQVIASVTEAIGKQAEKFEICARLGEEAARDVLKEVTGHWEKAGRPVLEPGEFDGAVQAAIEVCEMRYEERGKKLVKQGKAPAPAAAAAKGSDLPPALQGAEKLSDKDEDILKGLIDKTAPLATSQRAKPKTIGSSLGGSAPPRDLGRGDMDPREALRAVLAR